MSSLDPIYLWRSFIVSCENWSNNEEFNNEFNDVNDDLNDYFNHFTVLSSFPSRIFSELRNSLFEFMTISLHTVKTKILGQIKRDS